MTEQEQIRWDAMKDYSMTPEVRTDLVAYHEREVARLQGEVSKGNFDALPEYAVALAKRRAAELGVTLPETDQDKRGVIAAHNLLLKSKLDALIMVCQQAITILHNDNSQGIRRRSENDSTISKLEAAIKQAKL